MVQMIVSFILAFLFYAQNAIFGKKDKAIQVCVNRFDEETKQSFLELYDKVDADVDFNKSEEG